MQKSVCGCGFKCVFSVFQHFLGNKRSRFGLTKKNKSKYPSVQFDFFSYLCSLKPNIRNEKS